MSEEIKTKILAKGNWKVIIRPNKFEKERLELNTLLPTVTNCKISLRGWDYPHVHISGPYGKVTHNVDFVECITDFRNHTEIWKYYQSGLFGHRFAFPEDGNEISAKFWVLGNLYKFTEIYQFASNLASKDVLGESLKISVNIYNTKDRTLTFNDPELDFEFGCGSYDCKVNQLTFSDEYSKIDIIARAPEIALKRTKWVLERFGWISNNLEDLLASHQEPFLKGKLRIGI